MSQVKIQGNALGSGAFTIASPNSNTDRSITLPDADGTLFVSGQNPTLSAGTANGVAYLNGSKVLTTGSGFTFDGTNLGIGAGTALNRLHIRSGTSDTPIRTDTTVAYNFISLVNSTGNAFIGSNGNNLIFQPAGTTQLTLDTLGNMGLGVTPSAWNSALKTVQALSASISNNGGTTIFGSNVYYDSTYTPRYIGNNRAGAILHNATGGGEWSFNLAASGTVGAAITFTQAMTLDASGNLLVGSTTNTSGLRFLASDGTVSTGFLPYGGGSIAYTGTWTNHAFGFATNGSERARITSDGDFLCYSGNDGVVSASSLAAGTSANVFVGRHSATSTTTGTTSFVVRTNGNVINTNNSYGAISDAKLKENVVDATPKLEKLNQVRVVNFNMIGEEQKQLGVVAQELEQIFPGMVEESPDRDAEGNDLGTTTKSVKYSVFVPMLIKAIQELKAEIDALKGAK